MSQSSNSNKSNSYKSSTGSSRNGTSQQGGSNRQHGSSNHQHGSSITRVPSCPHCTNLNKFNAHKLDQPVLPTNHYLRETPSPDSKLVCPVLLATECRYCKDFGHTVSRCPLAVAENKRRELELARRASTASATTASAAAAKPEGKSNGKAHNCFSALDSDSDDEPTKRLVKSPYSSRTIISKTSSKKRKNPEAAAAAALQFDFPELPSISTLASTFAVVSTVVDSDKQTLNFIDAIKSQPVVKELVRGSGLPPMLVSINANANANANADNLTQQPVVKMGVFMMTRSSWADSDSDDDDSDCERQKRSDEHQAWMEEMQKRVLQKNTQTTLLIDESYDDEEIEIEREQTADSW